MRIASCAGSRKNCSGMVNEPLNEIWSRKRKPLANSLYVRFAPVWALVAVAASDTFTLRLAAVMLVPETKQSR